MKKFLTLALTAVMALSLLTACGSKNDNSADTNTDGSISAPFPMTTTSA